MREDLFDPTRHHAPILLVYMWRYGGHVGDQEQKRVVYHVSFPQSVPTICEGYILVNSFRSDNKHNSEQWTGGVLHAYLHRCSGHLAEGLHDELFTNAFISSWS